MFAAGPAPAWRRARAECTRHAVQAGQNDRIACPGSVAGIAPAARLTNQMTARFRCSDPLAGDFEFADVQEVLDALEAALVAPDTPMLDTARQSWQPVATHPEIRAA